MSVAAPPSYDKAIGGQRRGPRDAELSQTLRSARERLTSRTGAAPRFDAELLVRHAEALKNVAVAMPLPVLLTGFGLSVFLGIAQALVWGLVALAGYLSLFAVSHAFRGRSTRTAHRGVQSGERFDTVRWSRYFVLGHVAAGIGWAYLASLDCPSCGPMRFDIFQFSVLFIAIALTAVVSSTLRNVVAIAFLPLMLVLVFRIATNPEPVSMAMHAMVIAAVPFFTVVAEHLRRNTAERLKHQAEKDALIAELETARVNSDEARQRAEEANMAKSRFLATMSHELRTPLNAILGFSEVISNEILGPVGNETYKDYVKDIHVSGQHLLDLINEILDLSRVEAGRYTLNEEAVELPRIARDCISFVQLKSEQKGVRLQIQFEPELPQLWADERALRQVILNLLSNAVKFTPRGGEITVRVGWTAGGGQYVAVRDDGPGIAEEEIPVVLSSFGQGSSAIKSAEQGTGLGLPIVQSLVHMHDGEFIFRSRLGEGTEAIAVFPHARVLEVMPAFQDVA